MKLSIDKLKDIPETLLFPLKARYLETKKKGGIINDPKSVDILDALDYDAYKTNQHFAYWCMPSHDYFG